MLLTRIRHLPSLTQARFRTVCILLHHPSGSSESIRACTSILAITARTQTSSSAGRNLRAPPTSLLAILPRTEPTLRRTATICTPHRLRASNPWRRFRRLREASPNYHHLLADICLARQTSVHDARAAAGASSSLRRSTCRSLAASVLLWRGCSLAYVFARIRASTRDWRWSAAAGSRI